MTTFQSSKNFGFDVDMEMDFTENSRKRGEAIIPWNIFFYYAFQFHLQEKSGFAGKSLSIAIFVSLSSFFYPLDQIKLYLRIHWHLFCQKLVTFHLSVFDKLIILGWVLLRPALWRHQEMSKLKTLIKMKL